MANKITELTRTDIVDRLLLDELHFSGRLDTVSFLKRIWPLESMPSQDSRFKNAEGDIWQHTVNNNDYDDSTLLYQRLKINSIPDQQFITFLETCMLPIVARDPGRIEELAAMFNQYLPHDGFHAEAVGNVSGRKIFKIISSMGGSVAQTYEIVLSFAGEDRAFVEAVAALLIENDVSLFYDNYEQATLWGKNLIEHLHKVYSSSARYCVMFILKHYAEKVWPTHERRSAFEKAIEAKEEYILPARFDDTEIPGLHKHVSYVDLRRETPASLAKLVIRKLGRSMREADEDIPF